MGIRCSFCDKTEENVLKLISHGTVYICNECIYLCVEIIEDEITISYEATDFFENSKIKHYIDGVSLFEEFKENKIVANSKYLNKSIAILGVVKDIDRRDDGEEGYLVTLGVTGAEVLCYFKINYEHPIQKIRKDEFIIVEGTYIDYKPLGNKYINLILKDCMIIGIKGKRGSVDKEDINIIHKLPPETDENFGKATIVFKMARIE